MVIITGPTSSGKTSLALKLAAKFEGEIISADSRQVYRELNIGTGKVPVNSQHAVIKNDDVWQFNNTKIWGYDVADLNQVYSVSDFLKDTNKFIKDIKSRKKIPIIVGGTGYYIESLLIPKENFDIPPNLLLRTNLENKPLEELQKMLPKRVLKNLNESDIKNKRRLIRQIEIIEYYKETNLKKRNIKNKSILDDILIINLTAKDKEILLNRADDWVDQIWPKLLIEVERLIKKGYKDLEPLNNIIYKEAKLSVIKALTDEEAKLKAKISIHQYIKRQITFFKRFKTAKQINIQKRDYEKDVYTIVKQFITR